MKKYLYSFIAILLCFIIVTGCGKDEESKDKIETLTCKYNVGVNSMIYEYTYKNDEIDTIKETDKLALDVEKDQYDDYVDIIENTLKATYENRDGVEFKLTRYDDKKNIKFEIKSTPSKYSDEDKNNFEFKDKTIQDMKEYYEDQEFVCEIK